MQHSEYITPAYERHSQASIPLESFYSGPIFPRNASNNEEVYPHSAPRQYGKLSRHSSFPYFTPPDAVTPKNTANGISCNVSRSPTRLWKGVRKAFRASSLENQNNNEFTPKVKLAISAGILPVLKPSEVEHSKHISATLAPCSSLGFSATPVLEHDVDDETVISDTAGYREVVMVPCEDTTETKSSNVSFTNTSECIGCDLVINQVIEKGLLKGAYAPWTREPVKINGPS